MSGDSSGLVERVAKAIAASIYRTEGLETMNYASVEDYCRREWGHYAAEAQAALDACFEEPPRVAFWYEAGKPQRYRHERRVA